MSSKKKIAFVTPWPPQLTGVGEYAVGLICGLARLGEFDITVFTGCETPELINDLKIVSCTDQEIPNLSSFDLIIHQMGNNAYHLINYLILKKYGGIVQLHDLVVHEFMKYVVNEYQQNDKQVFYNILENSYGDHVVEIEKCLENESICLAKSGSIADYPLFEEVLQFTKTVIVHSEFSKAKIKEVFPHSTVIKLPLLYSIPQDIKKADTSNFKIGSFGYGDRFKHTDKLTRAFARLVSHLKEGNQPIPTLMLVGHGDFYQEKVWAKKLGITDYVTTISSPSLEEFDELMKQMNLIVQLRYPTKGESSAAVTKAMQFGIPVIVSDIGWYEELPDFIEKISGLPTVGIIYDTLKRMLEPSSKDISFEERAKVSKLYAESINYDDYLRDYSQWMNEFMKNDTKQSGIDSKEGDNAEVSKQTVPASHPASVLLDLSWGVAGFSSIPHDSRLLFNTLTEVSGVHVSGLLYGRSKSLLRENIDNFSEREITEKSIIVSSLLSHIVNSDHFSYHPNIIYRLLQNFKNHKMMLKKTDFELALIPRENFYDFIWRTVLSNTLSSDLYNKFKRQDFYASNINLDTMSFHAGFHRSIQLDTAKFDFVIFQDQRPITVSKNTTKIVRYHGAGPLIQSDTHAASVGIAHGRSMRLCKSDSFYVCNSEPSRDALLKINPRLEQRSVTIPYTIPAYYKKQCDSGKLRQIFECRSGTAKLRGDVDFEYILAMGSAELRKCHPSLIKAFKAVQIRRAKPVKLVIVSSEGGKNLKVDKEMQYLIDTGNLIHLQDLSYDELPYLYSSALTAIFPYFSEGFGFLPLETMLCECPVIASDIKVHRWAMGAAAMYFNPYNTHSMTEALEKMTCSADASAIRQEYIDKGLERVKLYSHEHVKDQWQELFDKLIAEKRSHG